MRQHSFVTQSPILCRCRASSTRISIEEPDMNPDDDYDGGPVEEPAEGDLLDDDGGPDGSDEEGPTELDVKSSFLCDRANECATISSVQ